ncbi:MAG TPA: ATP-binding protein, partial [Elusimicrobiales bacterium]|nr:ATP-binding protein [Elusimicrobiales bacterium]
AFHSYYYLPRWLLGETNEALLKVDKFFLLASGPMDEMVIGDWDDIRRKARIANYLRGDLPLLLSILFVVVGALILGIFRNHSNFSGYRTFSLACFTGGLFSMSLSRVLYFFSADYPLIYKYNCAAGILFFYFFLSFFYGSLDTARHFRKLNAAGAALGMIGILAGADVLSTTRAYAAWLFFIYVNLMLLMGYTLYYRRQLRDASIRATGVGLLLAATTHDILVYAGCATGGNMIPYAIFIVLFSFVFIVLTDMEQIYLAASRTAFAVGERNKLREDLEQVAKIAAIGQMAAQVAHDIRSPLAALDAVTKDVAQLPEDKRIMVRSAISRIRDIANHLLEKNRQARISADGASSAPPVRSEEICLLSGLIEPLISEKRLQFRSKIGVDIEAVMDESSYGMFARIQPAEFKRVLSNLVDNAVEVLGDKGVVNLGLTHEGGNIVLTVTDNGKGIPRDILEKLGQRGGTYGKAGGSGLGLYHARNSVESWGGTLKIGSEPGKGTTVTVTLPAAPGPDWFVSGLKLRPRSAVVILDDDTSIHRIWQGRFDSLGVKERGIEVLHFSAPEELRSWVRNNAEKPALYLTDHELLGYKETGLSLVEELGIGARSILVTSRYEEEDVLKSCLRLRVRMIPKGLAGLAPIEIEDDRGPDVPSPRPAARAVLLDDDVLTHMNWEMAARENGVSLETFTDPGRFMAAAEAMPKDIPIYIDSGLGDGVKGERIAGELHEKGFTNLTLATGHPPERFASLPWLRVIGKEPPWGGDRR